MYGFLSVIFFGASLYRLLSGKSKHGLLFRELGSADLLANLPFPLAEIPRLFRVFRLARLVRGIGCEAYSRTICATVREARF